MKNFVYISLKGALFVVSLIPIQAGYIFSRFLYFVLRYILRYRKKVIEANLRLVFPDKSIDEISAVTKKYYRHLSDLFVEMMYSLYIPEKILRKRIRFANPELLNKYYSEGRHVVAVTGHYANWEWGYGFPMYCRHKLVEVYKRMSNKISDRLFHDIRARFGGIPVEMSNLKPVLAEAQKHPTLVYLVADQTPAGNEKLWYYTSFLGVSGTPVFTGPEKIAQKFDAVFVFINMQKLKRGYYRLEFIPLSESSKITSVHELTDKYLRMMEKIIYDKPEYWMWSHRRWKRRKIAE
ncbi:MAG: lysophospholipid acyltransferase family protein [Prevotellaceae bacterium]|jgi:KDO2-lipid IV(A) lauroyltransferase|nr:lysophospholipid acyltransferase family protein [Prevotellaceae bacterium]